MPMLPYPVICYAPGCGLPAEFKIAARWSDGQTQELKTYSLTCSSCLAEQYASAVARRGACRLAPGETLDVPAVFEMNRGERDRTLKRRPDLEAHPRPSPTS